MMTEGKTDDVLDILQTSCLFSKNLQNFAFYLQIIFVKFPKIISVLFSNILHIYIYIYIYCKYYICIPIPRASEALQHWGGRKISVGY